MRIRARARRHGDLCAARAIQRSNHAGKNVYALYCATCHGARGEGDTPGAAGLHPRPVNLTEQEYTLATVSAFLYGTAWRAPRCRLGANCAVADLSAVARCGTGLSRRTAGAGHSRSGAGLGRTRVYAPAARSVTESKGDGNGSAAGQFAVAPTNFQAQRPSIAASLRAVRNGIEGTPMAPWSNELSEAELSAVAYYVRGFCAGGSNQ